MMQDNYIILYYIILLQTLLIFTWLQIHLWLYSIWNCTITIH